VYQGMAMGGIEEAESSMCCVVNRTRQYIWTIEWSIFHAFWMPGSMGIPGL